jgi:secreted trypsin-like serine protease
MKRILALNFLAAAMLVPASVAQAASPNASPSSASVHGTSKVHMHGTTKVHNYIAGGAVGSVPGVVAIVTPSGYCTGAVIAPKIVLTAAHCVADVTKASTIRVRFDHAHQNLGVSRYYTAPGFSPATHNNDAAVLILKSRSKEPALEVARAEPAAGTGARITGFGQHTYTSAVASVAYYANTTIQSFASCQATWAQFDSAVPSSDICAENAAYNATLTRGDSGGPLLVKTGSGNWSIAGINDLVVIPNDVYNGAIPQAFGRVDSIRPWIEGKIAQFG